ncbi:hypothetical protein MGS_01582 [Candida albicans P78042]|nr:hypothetical protein MGS_01582 [Candida albicans P78042]
MTTTSRLRKFDKSLIQESTSTETADNTELIDIDDQTNLIDQLTITNQINYAKSMKYLIYLYILQIVLVLSLSITQTKRSNNSINNSNANKKTHVDHRLQYILLILSICLNIINVKFGTITTTTTTNNNINNIISQGSSINLNKWMKWINRLITLQLLYHGYSMIIVSLTTNIIDQYRGILFMILPGFNISMPWLFFYWYKHMDESVQQLNELKYEYKNV